MINLSIICATVLLYKVLTIIQDRRKINEIQDNIQL